MNNRPHLIPCLIAAVMLLAAVGKWPYGYYMFVHVVTCGVAVYVAYFSYKNRIMWAVWVYGIMAVVFNPIIKFHLGREGWQIMNVAAAGLLLIAMAARKSQPITAEVDVTPKDIIKNENSGTGDIWEEFRGKGNARDVLTAKGGELAKWIMIFSKADIDHMSSEHIKQGNGDLSSEARIYIRFECVFLYLHLADRKAAQVLKPDQRKIFVTKCYDDVNKYITNLITNLTEVQAVAFNKEFKQQFNAHQEEYAKYNTEAQSRVAGTLMWEFGNKISSIISGGSADIFTIMSAMNTVTASSRAMDIDGLLSE